MCSSCLFYSDFIEEVNVYNVYKSKFDEEKYSYLSNTFIESQANVLFNEEVYCFLDRFIASIVSYDCSKFSILNTSDISELASLLLFLGESKALFKNETFYQELLYKYMSISKEILEFYGRGLNGASVGGVCDFAFAYYAVAQKNPLYKEASNVLSDEVAGILEERLEVLMHRVEFLKATDYDLLYGVSGSANYLLSIENYVKYRHVIRKTLEYIVKLSADKEVDGFTVPSYYISQRNQLTEEEKRLFPRGCLFFGLAHGVCGPLYVLVRAKAMGFEVEGSEKAINHIMRQVIKVAYFNTNGYISLNYS